MISSPDAAVYMLGNKLAVGEQLSGQECPFCARHGDRGEKSLSITRDTSAVVYQCHRAKCGARGWVRADSASSSARSSKAANANKWGAYLKHAAPLMQDEKNWCGERWSMQDRHLRKGSVEYSPSAKRLILPIFNPAGEEVGATLRAMHTKQTPKSMIVMEKADAFCMSFYKSAAPNPNVWIVVEDQASAIRASMYCSSVALLGVYMDAIRAREISKLKPDKVLWCLDKDAFNKTIEMAKKYGHMIKNSSAVCPPKDLKDMTEQELKSFLTYDCKLTIEEEVVVE